MTTETTVAPDVATQITASEVESPELTTQGAETESGDAEAVEAKVEEKSAEVKLLERELRKAQRINARLYQQTTAPRQQEGTTETPKGQDDPVSMAREIARIERFTEKSNDLVAKGTKAHQDFMPAIGALTKEVGPLVLRDGTPSAFMEVVMEVAEDQVALLYHLSKNEDLAEGLSDLSPIQLAKKLSRIERDMAEAAKPQTSKAPVPLTAVKSVGSVTKSLDDMSFTEYSAARRKFINSRKR